MNTQHLRYAVEVARTGSITEAAENLYITQPSLSKAIRELESNVGITIFERTPRGVIPTRKGRALLEHAQIILRQVSDIAALCVDDNPERQTFSVSFPRGSYLAQGFARFCESLDFEKPVHVRVRENNSLATIDEVAAGNFQLGVIRCAVSEEAYFQDYLTRKNMKSETIWEFQSMAMFSAQSPLAQKNPLEMDDLNGMVEVVYGDMKTPYLAEGASPGWDENKAIVVYQRTTQLEILSALENAFMWTAPAPAQILARYALAQRPCRHGSRRYRDILIYQEGHKFSDCDRAFIDKVFEAKNEVAFALKT